MLVTAIIGLFLVDKVTVTPPGSVASDVVQTLPVVLLALIVLTLVRGVACRRC